MPDRRNQRALLVSRQLFYGGPRAISSQFLAIPGCRRALASLNCLLQTVQAACRKRGREPFAGTARRVLRTKGSRPLFRRAAAPRRTNERRSRQAVRDDVPGVFHLGRVVPAHFWLPA